MNNVLNGKTEQKKWLSLPINIQYTIYGGYMTTTVNAVNKILNKFGSRFQEIVNPSFTNSFFTATLKSGISLRLVDWNGRLIIEAFEQEHGEDIWSSGVYIDDIDTFNPEQEKRDFFYVENWEC
jgi:hypothetical protein